MKGKIQLFLAAFSLLLSACDEGSRMLARSGMGSPMRYDAEPIKHRIKGNYFQIPANCYDAPIEVEGYDDGYAIDDGALFVTILPTLACRTQETKRRFQETGPGRSRLMILVSATGQGVQPNDGFDRNFLFLSCQTKHSSCIPGSLKSVKETQGEHFYQFNVNSLRVPISGSAAGSAQGSNAFDTVDVIYSKVRRSFAICTQFTSAKVSGLSPRIPGCQHFFRYRNLIIKLNYGRAWLDSRNTIETAVTRLTAFQALDQNSFRGARCSYPGK